MTAHKEAINPLVILALAVPASGIYLARVIFTGYSLGWAAIGYISTGLGFGLIQSLFTVRRRFLIAFLSTAFVPILAYLAIAGLMILSGVGIILFGQIPGGYSSEIVAIPLNERIGQALGIALFALVLTALVIPFGLIGIVGRFLGDEVVPRMLDKLLPGASKNWSTPKLQFLTSLNQVIADHFDLEEIRNMSFELGIDYEEIPGDRKSSKIRELIIYVDNRDLTLQLVNLIKQYRPRVSLPSPPASWHEEKVTTEELEKEIDRHEQVATRLAMYVVLAVSGLLIASGAFIAFLPSFAN